MHDGTTRSARGARRTARRATPYSKENLSIKGSSGPTLVVVANLVKGTSPEDVRLTFEPLGRLAHVRRYSMPNLASDAVAFEVAFEQRGDATAACKKYDGVLADGRVLQVTLAERLERAQPAPKQPARARKERGAEQKPRIEEEQLPLPVLRRLAEAEARYLAETERILKEKDVPHTKDGQPLTLKQRLGSLPLAQRLEAGAAAPSKSKRRRQKKSMDVDA